MKNFIILGPQGVGKGTQAIRLAENFGLIHLSTGDLLRAEIKSGSELGKKVQSIVEAGELVEDEISIELIKQKIESNPSANGFVFDGFPRNKKQAEALDEMLNQKGYPIKGVFNLMAPKSELIKRLLKRALEEGRTDDNEKIIENRLNIYEQKTQPLIDYYFAQNKLLVIDGDRLIRPISEDLRKLAARF